MSEDIEMRIEFRKSNSAYFKDALALAQQVPTYDEIKTGGSTVYSVTFSKSYFDRFVELARIVWGWKTTRIVLGRRNIRPGDFWRLSRTLECHIRRQEFENKRLYCFVSDDYYGSKQLFPCKFIRLSLADLVSGGKYGEVSSSGSIYLDKERIAFEIERQLRLELAFYCPSFNHELSAVILEQLPDVISASDIEAIQRKQRTLWTFTSAIELGTADAEDEAASKLEETKKLEKLLGDIDTDLDKLS